MFSDLTLITINAICIFFLITMLIVLAAATRMKAGSAWASLFIITTNMPVMLANLMRDVAPGCWPYFVYPAYTFNMMVIPSLWFFTRLQMDKPFRLTARSLLHLLPALVSLAAHIVYYAPLTAPQVEAELTLLRAGGKNLPGILNDAFLYAQLIVYFTLILRHVRSRMKYLRDHYSDSGYNDVSLTPRILAIYFIGLSVAAVGYAINPRTDTWLIPMANAAGMAYLVYCVIFHSTTAYLNRIEEAPSNSPEGGELSPFGGVRGGLSRAYMKEICDRATNYLTTSGAYANPDFSVAMLAVEIGISTRNISTAINGYLKKNFFNLINEMRVEKAKEALCSLGDHHTIDSVAGECGFRSRSSFFAAFKKAEGKTPQQWLKSVTNITHEQLNP